MATSRLERRRLGDTGSDGAQQHGCIDGEPSSFGDGGEKAATTLGVTLLSPRLSLLSFNGDDGGSKADQQRRRRLGLDGRTAAATCFLARTTTATETREDDDECEAVAASPLHASLLPTA
ncbi:hypothetical protein HN51_019759 [Arachis hypogaea]